MFLQSTYAFRSTKMEKWPMKKAKTGEVKRKKCKVCVVLQRKAQ